MSEFVPVSTIDNTIRKEICSRPSGGVA